MCLLEGLHEPAIELIFKYIDDIDTCVSLHDIVHVPGYIWENKIRELFNKRPEELLWNPDTPDNVVLGCIYSGKNDKQINYHQRIALHFRCHKGNYQQVKLLINNDVNINSTDHAFKTALYKACYNKHYDIVKLLVDNGADVNISDIFDYTPLYLICGTWKGNVKIAKLLIDNGANVNAVNGHGDTPLSIAIRCENIEIVELLIENGAHLNINC